MNKNEAIETIKNIIYSPTNIQTIIDIIYNFDIEAYYNGYNAGYKDGYKDGCSK